MKKLRILRLKPSSRASSAAHVLLNLLLVGLLLLFIAKPISIPALAVVVLLLSKWRMLAVKPRYWLANIRSNMVDIGVGLSTITFMWRAEHLWVQLVWAVIYAAWLIFLKPRSSMAMVILQAMLAQGAMLIALHGSFPDWGVLALVGFTWLICYSSARHFFGAFEESSGREIAYFWGLFGAELAWVLSHWQLGYGFVPQVALLITVIGYVLAVSYYIHATRGLKSSMRTQLLVLAIIIIAVVALFSQWQYSGA